MERKKLVIGHLFPDLLNMYSDGGNIITLKNRLLWRDFEVEIREFEKDDVIDFSVLDFVFLGGGSDREQLLACENLKKQQLALKEYIESDGVLLAVCGGYPLLGRSCPLMEEMHEGLSLMDIHTEAGEERVIGNVVISTDITGEEMPVVGFENHSGKTYIGACRPFGRVRYGHGNNSEDGTCGAVYKNVVGTYLHGPLLPKNPRLADELLARALRRKYGEDLSLSPLHDAAEEAAQDYIIKRFLQD
ncbi:MAG: glutamine amidotransferase [Ruminococcaceae bacterium]|nr:glutamine amidotransferase [Oscillospiraceae bacterium]